MRPSLLPRRSAISYGGAMARAFEPARKELNMAASRIRRWSQRVTERSDALDLESKVFSRGNPASIACPLKRSAEHSDRRKSEPHRSAMSMLTFYINRAGKNLSKRRRDTLERAKDELRRLFHKSQPNRR